MREERKLNKALRRDGIETQADILDELKQRYPQYAVRQKDVGTVKRKRIAVISSLAAVAACIAIIVPCAVLLPNNVGDGGEYGRYSSYNEDDYKAVESKYTLREYSESTGGKILYFDWYDIADDCLTYNYRSNADGRIFAFEEYMYFDSTIESIHLVVTKTNVYINAYSYNVNKYKKEHIVENHTVKWWIDDFEALCMLEDGGYRYFIRIEKGRDENRLFELAGELLQKN